jgi:hypothetical protein
VDGIFECKVLQCPASIVLNAKITSVHTHVAQNGGNLLPEQWSDKATAENPGGALLSSIRVVQMIIQYIRSFACNYPHRPMLPAKKRSKTAE